MKKKITMIMLSACILGTLVGCGNENMNKPASPATEN